MPMRNVRRNRSPSWGVVMPRRRSSQGQAVLKRLDHPLDTPLRLRRMPSDHLDADHGKRSFDIRRSDAAAVLCRAFVGVFHPP